MLFITVPQANNPTPLYNSSLDAVKKEYEKKSSPFNNSLYSLDMSNLADAGYVHNYSWEYYSNELEFE